MFDEGNEVSVDDFEAMEAEKKIPAVPVADGDDIPEAFRGKSVKEIADAADRAQQALRISENARLKALEDRANAPLAPAAPVVTEQAPQELTEEEFDALYEEDPKRALRIAAERIALTTERNVLARIAPMQAGARSQAESMARQKYPDEFEILSEEIKAVVAKIPNPQYLSSPDAWDDVIAYVRGHNIDKIVERKIKKASESNEAAARAAQTANAGFTGSRAMSPVVPAGNDPKHYGLDETERKVADTLGQSYSEYARYKKMGN